MIERSASPHISRILPMQRNVEAILSFTNADLQAVGLPAQEAEQIANPENSKHLEAQRNGLILHPARYLGAFASNQLAGGKLKGFIKYNEWRAADELPYAEAVEARLLQEMIAAERHHLAGRPLGIFALALDPSLSPTEQPRFASALLHSVLAKFAEKEVRIGIHANDPLKPLLRTNNFSPTDRHGEPIPGLSQELYIRPPVS